MRLSISPGTFHIRKVLQDAITIALENMCKKALFILTH